MLQIDDMIDQVQEISVSRHDVARINSIKKLYDAERYDSKMPTFALTYQGTYMTLMAKGGFSKIVAKQIEERYHTLYKASDDWVAAKLDQASHDGYITAAFGLRVRTPLLAQVVRGNSKTPHEAEAEGRTAGNALGQSWCLLNSRAWVEFMRKVRAHPEYRTMIRPCAQIHDAGYALIPDDIELLQWMNKHLVEAVNWQDHPDIAHSEVGLGGELSVFFPSWAHECELKNDATADAIRQAVSTHLEELAKKGVI